MWEPETTLVFSCFFSFKGLQRVLQNNLFQFNVNRILHSLNELFLTVRWMEHLVYDDSVHEQPVDSAQQCSQIQWLRRWGEGGRSLYSPNRLLSPDDRAACESTDRLQRAPFHELAAEWPETNCRLDGNNFWLSVPATVAVRQTGISWDRLMVAICKRCRRTASTNTKLTR